MLFRRDYGQDYNDQHQIRDDTGDEAEADLGGRQKAFSRLLKTCVFCSEQRIAMKFSTRFPVCSHMLGFAKVRTTSKINN